MPQIAVSDETYEKIKDQLIPCGNRHLVVLDRGWIFAGDLANHSEGGYILTNAKNVRRWEEGGFGALSRSAKAAKAHLDDCAPIRFSANACIFKTPIGGDWDA